jgi:hypothetical protein
VKVRDAVGRRIVKVNQHRFWNVHNGSWCVDVTSIDLDNGTSLLPMTVECEADYATEMVVLKHWRNRT